MGSRVSRIRCWGIGIMIGGRGVRAKIGGRAGVYWHWSVAIRCGWGRGETISSIVVNDGRVLGVSRSHGDKN